MNVNVSHHKLEPKVALVVYERAKRHEDRKDNMTPDMPNFYVESHALHETEAGRYSLGSGSPITYESIGQLAEAFKEQASSIGTVGGMFPENLLYAHQSPGIRRLIWFDKPTKRKWFGSAGGLELEGMGPAMLYILDNETLRVYAMDCKGRPTGRTNLYRTKWNNISADGVVCIGSTQFDRYSPTYSGMIREWTSAFWNSRFTGLTEQSPLAKQVKVANEKGAFPVKHLENFSNFADFCARVENIG